MQTNANTHVRLPPSMAEAMLYIKQEKELPSLTFIPIFLLAPAKSEEVLTTVGSNNSNPRFVSDTKPVVSKVKSRKVPEVDIKDIEYEDLDQSQMKESRDSPDKPIQVIQDI
jgi:hypothetical protein